MAVTIAVGALWVFAVSAAGAAHRGCASLRGHNLVRGKRIEVVAGPGTVNICVLPNGRVFRGLYPTGHSHGASVAAVAGYWVAVSTTGADQVSTDESGDVYNAATGATYNYYSSMTNLPGFGPPSGPSDPFAPVSLRIDRAGELAGLFSDGTTTEVEGFTRGGAESLLDSGPAGAIPAQSLSLVGGTVSWSDAGQPRSAMIGA